ncbi:CDP-diacylglycerol--serine O-phosphatidyltransferase [Candidatus Saccharibacteria bacterium]|nr:MAG: CDP-diacylglycerol--serine O-phosphatidyltransferase [Candidatus Saccharibacteria bacterium]
MQKSIPKIMKLPDYVTCLNLVAGLLSIYSAIHGYFMTAAVLLLLGVFFDAIDGYVARRMHIESKFGAELDSLADLVTFGVAPMVLVTAHYNTPWLSLLAILLPVCGALRLARHNINRHLTKGYLIGLPITVSGVTVPLLIVLQLNKNIAAAVIVALSIFYVSTRRVNKLLH